MKHYVLYNHGGSDNHGCEAIVRSTIPLLAPERDSLILYSLRPEPDHAAGLDKLCTILKEGTQKPSRDFFQPEWLKGYLAMKLKKDYHPIEAYYKFLALNVKKGDVALSIGGDNYCYGGTDAMASRNRFFRRHGLKTVLWGCSVEPSLLEKPSIAQDLAAFDCILARESISYEALKKVNPNTVLVCDPAFLLETSCPPLPAPLQDKAFVGINLSPLAEKNETIPGLARRNFEALMAYILERTPYGILLFPHVICHWDDDRTVLKELYAKYAHTGRVVLLEDAGCTELKGYIARCRFVVTARTHASIAGYSSCVPTLVLGYSVKSRGIARDLFGTEEHYVVPVQNLTREDELVEHFEWLEGHEREIVDRLKAVLPAYKDRIVRGAEAVRAL